MRKTYTLVEIITVGVFFVGLVAIGLPFYQNSIERSRAVICQLHLKVLHEALESYAKQNNILPASLIEINAPTVRKAWSAVMDRQNKLFIAIAYCLVRGQTESIAYAEESGARRYLPGQVTFLTCPSDITSPPGGVSYSLNERFRNMSLSSYNRIKQSDALTVVIADGNAPLFAMLDECDYRHHRTGLFSKIIYALGSTVSMGKIERVEIPVQMGSSGKARLIKDNGSLAETTITAAVPATTTYGSLQIEGVKDRLSRLEDQIAVWKQKAGKQWSAAEENLTDTMRETAVKARELIEEFSLSDQQQNQGKKFFDDSLQALSGQLRALEQKLDERLKGKKN